VSTPVLAGLVVTVAVTALAWVLPLPDPGVPTTATAAVRLRDTGLRTAIVALGPLALAVTAVFALTGSGDDDLLPLGLVLAVLAAVLGGGPVTAAVLRMAPQEPPLTGAPAPATVLRGGATIGVLERLAISVALLVSWPEGIAIVLAVKGLGRYPELRAHAGTSERFIIGTFASVLWALACAGVALLGWAR
jgi:hypothetical protein